jgi:hypothetical protein
LFIDERIRRGPEGIGRPGEHLALGCKLDVNLHPDEDFVGLNLTLRRKLWHANHSIAGTRTVV